ncbi:MAG: hypothetical protein Q9221_002160 [Calogaya cf. arnoldii]
MVDVLDNTRMRSFAKYGQRLLPTVIDEIAQNDPERRSINKLPESEFMRGVIIPDLDFLLPSRDVPNYPYMTTFDEASYSPFVILNTSGSTGLPQPITVNHGTLVSFDAQQLIPALTGKSLFGTSLSGTRMLMGCPYFYMASGTLLLGLAVYYGVVVVLPPANRPLHADSVNATLNDTKIDGCALPPSILVDIYHGKSLASQVHCFRGPLPPEVVNTIAKITHLSALFGSTEIGFPTQGVCDPGDWEYANYSPFYGSYLRPIDEDGLFEHVFVRRREFGLSQSMFSTYSDIDEFATKDLYRKDPAKTDLWKFCGRLDDVIVLSNAEKFNPVGFESAVAAHPAVRWALVDGHRKSRTCLLVAVRLPSPRRGTWSSCTRSGQPYQRRIVQARPMQE